MELIEIPMHNSILLRGLCYFNKDNNIKKSSNVVLSMSPYRIFEDTEEIKSFGKFISNMVNPCHYIYMDIRGTGESDGVATNEYSTDEILDTMQCLIFIRNQIWSNKIIIMHGLSYSAFNALQSCSNSIKPDALFLMHVSNDRWYNDVHYFSGVKTITEDLNYSFAMTGENLLSCNRCLTKDRYNNNDIPWFMKWMRQGHRRNKEWYNGMINDKLPPTFLICGWRDSYSPTAVILSNLTSFTLIGPFGHTYPYNHNTLFEWWINYIKKNKISKKPYCIVIPTPRSLWKLGYYRVPAYISQKIQSSDFNISINNNVILKPDLVGDTLEVYISGDPYNEPTLDSVQNDLLRNNCGYKYIIYPLQNILSYNNFIWGIPYIMFDCKEYKKGDYIVARLTTDTGETLSVGVGRIVNGNNIIDMRPFFIPIDIDTRIYLFLNRSWVPVLYPTTNMNTVTLNNIKIKLPIINTRKCYPLNIFPHKNDIELLKDVKPKKKYKDNVLVYKVINDNSKDFKEYLTATFNLGKETHVVVKDYYHDINTITEVISNKTDEFKINIKAYKNKKGINTFIQEWNMNHTI